METILPVPIYPIGEFADGFRLCASVEGEDVSWFHEHKDFDLGEMDDRDLQAAPTLVDAVELDESDFLEWN